MILITNDANSGNIFFNKRILISLTENDSRIYLLERKTQLSLSYGFNAVI